MYSRYTNVSNFHGAGRGTGYLYSMLMHSIILSSCCLAGYVKMRLSSVVGVAGIVVIRVLVPGGLRRFVPKINKKKKVTSTPPEKEKWKIISISNLPPQKPEPPPLVTHPTYLPPFASTLCNFAPPRLIPFIKFLVLDLPMSPFSEGSSSPTVISRINNLRFVCRRDQ